MNTKQERELEQICLKYTNNGGCSKCPCAELHKNSFGDNVYTCKIK